MEIPDLNFKKSKTQHAIQEQTEFYTVKSHIQQDGSYNQNSRSIYQQTFTCIIEDEIEKKTMNVAWQTRYFYLTPTRLLYYIDKNRQYIKGCFNLASLQAHKVKVKQCEHILKLVVHISQNNDMEKQILLLNFESNPLRLVVWKKQIQLALSKCKKIEQKFSPRIQLDEIKNTHLKIHGDNFWNRIFISSLQMRFFVNQLDIIFFKSKNPIASVHRLFMRSKFDHVGILLRDSHNNILVLQAIQSRGVWINQWQKMVNTFQQHYEQIAIRKLLLGKHKIDFLRLQNYLDAVIGKKYELSLSKLFTQQDQSSAQQLNKKQQNKQNLNENQLNIQSSKSIKQKTFFCSQLIADIYLKCGFITGRKRNQFWPRDFQSNDLTLQHGVQLSPLMYLRF